MKRRKLTISPRLKYALAGAARHGIVAGGVYATFAQFHRLVEFKLIAPTGERALTEGVAYLEVGHD